MKSYYFPKNLNLTEILKNNPPKFHYNLDCFVLIIGTITYLRTVYKDYQDLDFIPLNAQVLQSKIRSYNFYLDYLLTNGIILTDNQYIPNQKSRGYKIAEAYIVDGFRLFTITKRSLCKVSNEETERLKYLNDNYHYLTKWFNPNLQIDKTKADIYLKMLLKNDLSDNDSKAYLRYYHRKNAVQMLNNGIYHLSVDSNIKRFHSNITNLKSELRKFVTYSGKRLCSIDVKNSQPFLATIFFNKNFYSKVKDETNLYNLDQKVYSSILPSIPSILSILSSIPSYSSIIMLVKSTIEECGNEFELFCTLVDRGLFYKYLSEKYGEITNTKYDLDIPENKRKFKGMIFEVLYSTNWFINQKEAEMKRFFRKLFPRVYKVFSLIKRKGQNSNLPRILQLVESEIVVRRVAKIFTETYKDVPVYTIHDSLVTLEEYKQQAYDLMKQEFEKVIQLKPSLHVEIW